MRWPQQQTAASPRPGGRESEMTGQPAAVLGGLVQLGVSTREGTDPFRSGPHPGDLR